MPESGFKIGDEIYFVGFDSKLRKAIVRGDYNGDLLVDVIGEDVSLAWKGVPVRYPLTKEKAFAYRLVEGRKHDRKPNSGVSELWSLLHAPANTRCVL